LSFYFLCKMDDVDYVEYSHYNYSSITTAEGTVSQHKESCLKEGTCMLLTVINVVIFLLGFFGNILVIWISGFKMRKTVNTTWYLSLAMSDFLFCAFLPFNIVNIAMKEWFFGSFMCKFTSAALSINMFSSIFLLLIISMDRCVSVMFPVWAQNHRSVQKASAVVVFAWLLAAGMSIPSLIYRQVHTNSDGSQSCYTNYDTTSTHMITVVTRFIVGFGVPFTIIIICYSIIIFKLQNNRMAKSSKPFKVTTALIVAFFVCWLPYHVFVLMELNHRQYDLNVLTTGIRVVSSLASANSFLNPLLYIFMGKDFQKKLKSSLISKMENAMADERPTTTSRHI
uniref:Chemerin chemokine-like receptor 1 n=1 Tax=Poecilia latipinna TaxID=48699 RepID=A0A3B3V4W8_9TELE